MDKYLINEKKIASDRALEKNLLEFQNCISSLYYVMRDYLNLGLDSANHPVLVKRTKSQFFKAINKQFNNLEKCIVLLFQKQKKHKNHSNAYLIEHIIDATEWSDDYFYLNLHLIEKILNKYQSKIENLKDMSLYKRNELLKGYCGYLSEMSFDVSSFIFEYYNFKHNQYCNYVTENRCIVEDSCFQQMNMPRSCKTHKSHATDILGVCQSVLNKYFYLDDVHVIPVAVFQLRQIIEIRMLECLGIKGIYKDINFEKLNTRITGNHLLDIPEINDGIIFPVSTSALQKIYGWACGYVHRGLVDNYWMVCFIQEYLVDFVCRPAFMSKSFLDNRRSYIAKSNKINDNCIDLGDTLNIEIINNQDDFEKLKEEIKLKNYETVYKKREEKYMEQLKKRFQ